MYLIHILNICILVLNINIILGKNINILLENIENIDKLDILFEYLYALVLNIDILLINIDIFLKNIDVLDILFEY